MLGYAKPVCAVFAALFFLTLASNPVSHAMKPRKSTSQAKTERARADTRNLGWDLKVKKKVYQKQLAMLRRKRVRIDNDKRMVAKLRRILKKLKKQALIPNLPYEVHYVDLPVVNAVCYPGGGILFFKGIFDKKEGLLNPNDEDEIAAVMGHEIAHATLRHAYKRQKKAATIGVIGAIASTALHAGAGANASGLFGAFFDMGTGLYFPSYSRKNEYEADLEGVFLMLGSGFNPDKAVGIWERAAKKRGGGRTSIYASHPASPKRAQALKKHIANLRAS